MKIDRTGMRYANLTVIGWSHSEYRSSRHGSYQFWKCKCDCGSECVVLANNLSSGNTTSCGCKSSRQNIGRRIKKHGKVGSPEYVSWRAMKDRCYCVTHKEYKRYGALGIEVCERWKNSFENFLEDMGERPEGFSLERIDPYKNYEPSNCRWANVIDQANNRKNNRKVEYNGSVKTLAEWAKETGLMRSTIAARLNRGWSVDMALQNNLS